MNRSRNKGGVGKNDRKLTFRLKNKKINQEKKIVNMAKKDNSVRNKWGRFKNVKQVNTEPKETIEPVTIPEIIEDSNEPFEFDICIVITTFNREDKLKILLDDIHKNSLDYKIIIGLFDDCSENIPDLKEYQDKLKIVYTRYFENHAKKNYWKLITNTMNFCKGISSKYFIYLPDDISLVDDFFNKSIQIFERIKEKNKICLSLLTTNTIRTAKISTWTKFNIIENEETYQTQFNDLCFISNKKLFELLNYQVNKPNDSLWKKKSKYEFWRWC